MAFPESRPRRLRKTEALRALVRETILTPADFIWPLFVVPGRGVKQPISSMPGQYRWSADLAAEEASKAWDLGVKAVILFGIPEAKDATGSHAFKKDGPVPETIRAIAKAVPEMVIMTDVCMCEYTDHGHCGIVEKGEVLNDPTLELLAREALTHARAGAHVVAPSDMMDGRVGFIREQLDEEGFEDIAIMAYSAKYASAFYGPFRDAADSAPAFGDRRSYQMDPANANEGLREALLDEEEGADIVMVKPAGPYLDIVRAVREQTDLPVAAYQVSGEYAMIHAAAERGWLDLDRTALESLVGIKRAGADMILTYFAPHAAKLLK
ncbi:MAG: porphobilinogen synthase [Deltaproteobacteria bacterium]|nr:MAG: porphobilinogen synthase [Deltaproteobacteria bacterium]